MGIDTKNKRSSRKRKMTDKEVKNGPIAKKPFKSKKNKPFKPSKLKKIAKEVSNEPKTYDIPQLEEKIAKLVEMEEPVNKKSRKKLRQLQHLHRKILQTTLTAQSLGLVKETDNPEDVAASEETVASPAMEMEEESEDETQKGVKRFVLFIGNLSKDTKDTHLKAHFAKVGKIKSVRIPEMKENRKSGFAFIELEDNVAFEKTLSMHHTMLHNRRINVLFTNPDGKNLDLKEIRKKNAKFDAMRKAGTLAGSIPENKRRSFRRKKKRLAEAAKLQNL